MVFTISFSHFPFQTIVCIVGMGLQEYGIKGFPTIKVFAPGKPPVDYQGARDVKPIAEFALSQVISALLLLIF